jgi:hypothetical protein
MQQQKTLKLDMSANSNGILVSILESLGSSYKSLTLPLLQSIRTVSTREDFVRGVLSREITQSLKTGILNVSNKSSYSDSGLPPKFQKIAQSVKGESQ